VGAVLRGSGHDFGVYDLGAGVNGA